MLKSEPPFVNAHSLKGRFLVFFLVFFRLCPKKESISFITLNFLLEFIISLDYLLAFQMKDSILGGRSLLCIFLNQFNLLVNFLSYYDYTSSIMELFFIFYNDLYFFLLSSCYRLGSFLLFSFVNWVQLASEKSKEKWLKLLYILYSLERRILQLESWEVNGVCIDFNNQSTLSPNLGSLYFLNSILAILYLILSKSLTNFIQLHYSCRQNLTNLFWRAVIRYLTSQQYFVSWS